MNKKINVLLCLSMLISISSFTMQRKQDIQHEQIAAEQLEEIESSDIELPSEAEDFDVQIPAEASSSQETPQTGYIRRPTVSWRFGVHRAGGPMISGPIIQKLRNQYKYLPEMVRKFATVEPKELESWFISAPIMLERDALRRRDIELLLTFANQMLQFMKDNSKKQDLTEFITFKMTLESALRQQTK